MSDAIHPSLLAMLQIARRAGDRAMACRAITKQALALSGASLVTLGFCHPTRASLLIEFTAGSDRPPFDRALKAAHIDLIGSRHPLDTPWVKMVFERERSVHSRSFAHLLPPTVPAAVSNALARAVRFRSWLGLPLFSGDKATGLLTFIYTAQDPEPDLAQLSGCAQIAVLVLNALNLRLAQQTFEHLLHTLSGAAGQPEVESVNLEIRVRPDLAADRRRGIHVSLAGSAGEQAAEFMHGLLHMLASSEIELQRDGKELGWGLYIGRADRPDAVPSPGRRSAQDTAGPAASQQILVVEDNPVNQQMMRTILEKRGWQVTVAASGQQAVEQMEQQTFNLVLMDIEMPGLDGLSAARQIRHWEKERGEHTPIICMTAHSSWDDHLHILQAGMDGHLAKPIRPQQLLETVEQTLSPASATGGLETLLDTLGGDRKLLAEITELFVHHYPGLLDEMATALVENDAASFTRCAHTIKGECAQFGAEEARAAAYQLEMMGRDEQLAEAPAVLFTLRIELARFVSALRQSGTLES